VAEVLTLTSAEVKPAITTTYYRVIHLGLWKETPMIAIGLRGENGERKDFIYGGSEASSADKIKALNLMTALNKANLSTTSLEKRILNQLVTDGLLSGAITGTPD